MKRKFINGLLLVAMTVAATSSFVSCKDYEDDNHARLTADYKDADAALKKALQDQIDEIKNNLPDECDCEITKQSQVEDLIKTWWGGLNGGNGNATLADAINGYLNAPNGTQTIVTILEGLGYSAGGSEVDLTEVWAAINKTSTRLDSIVKVYKLEIPLLQTRVIQLGDSLAQAYVDIKNAQALAERDSIRIDTLAAEVTRVENLAKTYLDSALQAAIDGDLKVTEAFQKADSLLQDSIDAVAKEVKELATRVDKIEAAMREQVTSIEIQATANPVIGYLNTPLGLTSTIIAAYYGKVESANGLEFPTKKARFFTVDSDIAEQLADYAIATNDIVADQDEYLIGEEGNGGKIYLTVNPNTTTIDSKKFALVNSHDEEAEATLGTFAASDFRITAGYTRANNGFYEAPVTIDNPAKVAAKVNFSNIKSALIDAYQQQSRQSLKSLAKTLYTNAYDNANDLGDLYAVKTSYYDEVTEEWKSVYSKYEVMVTSIAPLKFTTGKEISADRIPGVDRLEDFVSNAVNKLTSAVDGLKLEDLGEITDINLMDGIDWASMVINVNTTTGVTVNIGQVEFSGDNEYTTIEVLDDGGNKVGSATLAAGDIHIEGKTAYISQDVTVPINVTVPIDDFVYNLLNSMNGNLQGALAPVNDILKQAQTINPSIENAGNTIIGYIEAFNNKVMGYVNRVNTLLQPVTLVSTAKGYARLSAAEGLPTQVSDTKVTLCPTTYTAELFAPAYKKYVAVFDVEKKDTPIYGTDENGNKLEGAFDGDIRQVDVELEAGKTYAVVYEAVDYYGNVAARIGYIKVAE